ALSYEARPRQAAPGHTWISSRPLRCTNISARASGRARASPQRAPAHSQQCCAGCRSFAKRSVHRARDFRSDALAATRSGADGSRTQTWNAHRRRVRETAGAENIGKLAAHRVADRMTVERIEPVQHELSDVHADRPPRHAHPSTSFPDSVFSSFTYSARAAWSRRRIVTGVSSRAAPNAAFTAMLRMFPPVIESRASFS